MASQLWGIYSVADHCVPNAFVADLVLYDRIVVPVPGDKQERRRWEKEDWQSGRQKTLLAQLGDYVKKVEWTPELREDWAKMGGGDEAEDLGTDAAEDVGMTADAERQIRAGRTDPHGDTRKVIAREVGAALLDGVDARVLSVYSERDRFDRHWRVTKTFPFVRRRTEVDRAQSPRAVEGLATEEQRALDKQNELGTIIVGAFVLPIDEAVPSKPDDQRDRETLERARKLLEDKNIAAKRRALHGWIAKYDPKALPTETKVAEFEDLLAAYNAAVRAKKKVRWIDNAVLILRPAAAGVTMFASEASMAGPIGGAIGTLAMRRFAPGEWEPADIRAAALISEASKQLRG